MLRRAVILSLLMIGLPVPTAGQEPARKAAWVVDYGELWCTIRREVDRPAPLAFGIRLIPGDQYTELLIIDPRWDRNPVGAGEKVRVTLAPSGKVVEGFAGLAMLDDKKTRVLLVHRIGQDLLDLFPSVSSITFSKGTVTLAEVPLSGTAKAIKALRDCSDSLLRAWGADPRQLDNLQRRPIGDARTFFRHTDYPAIAVRNNVSGAVTALYTIGASGRVEDCKVVGSSDEKSLDEVTCEILLKRARFEPALAANGEPVSVKQVVTVRWWLG